MSLLFRLLRHADRVPKADIQRHLHYQDKLMTRQLDSLQEADNLIRMNEVKTVSSFQGTKTKQRERVRVIAATTR